LLRSATGIGVAPSLEGDGGHLASFERGEKLEQAFSAAGKGLSVSEQRNDRFLPVCRQKVARKKFN
jgi:hypothetical protein